MPHGGAVEEVSMNVREPFTANLCSSVTTQYFHLKSGIRLLKKAPNFHVVLELTDCDNLFENTEDGKFEKYFVLLLFLCYHTKEKHKNKHLHFFFCSRDPNPLP